MNGGDHQRPQPWLGRVLSEANQLQDDYDLTVMSLEDYLRHAPITGLPTWTGELRSGARANLLPGVLSNRVDVKQAAARAERALERQAEPLCALFLPPEQWPEPFLRLAWQELLRNAAHDSSCACSADEVVDAVLSRYAAARQIADGLVQEALGGFDTSTPGPVVVNPSARRRRGLVELVLAGTPPPGTQPVVVVDAVSTERTVTGREVTTLIGQIANEALAVGGVITGAEVLSGDDGLDVVLHTGPPAAVNPTAASELGSLYALAGAHRDAPARVRVERTPFCRVLADSGEVEGFGWRTWSPEGRPAVGPVRAAGGTMENELVRVEVDPYDGTFAIDGHGGLDRLVDGGDAGDTYNYSPPPGDTLVDHPSAVNVDAVESGPLRAALEVTRTYGWSEQSVTVVTRLELRAGERLVRITTSFDNTRRNHRLRAWFPLPEAATTSRAECAFTVVERGLTAEGGPHERGIPTFPSRRFVAAGGLTVVHDGLLEYELMPGPPPALALTLLRCVGMLSGTDLAYRPMPAGPPVPVEGAQMQGPRVLCYGVALGPEWPSRAGDTAPIDPYGLADDAFLPLLVTTATGTGRRPASGSALSVECAEVSAVRRAGDRLEVRVFNPTDQATTVALAGHSGWLVDLRGRPLEPFDESFPLRPHGIATLRLSTRAGP